MFPTPAELLQKIRLGEDSSLELKEVRLSGARVTGPSRDKLADELAALANSSGGVLVLGVDDRSRTVLGLPVDSLDVIETFVRDCCLDSVKPPLAPRIERLLLPDASGTPVPVIRVDVHRSLFVHQSPGGYVHRVGSSSRQMSPDYLARLFQQRSQTRLIRFDEQCVSVASLEHLKPELWQRFLGDQQTGAPADLLCRLGMARPDDDGTIRPTVAGVLLGCEDARRFLPHAYIQAVAYRFEPDQADSLERYQLDAQDITGPLDAQVRAACAFVSRNSARSASKKEGRVETPEYDETAVFEAMVNAVAHRDYALHGARIRLKLFPGRLELSTPGALPNTMTVDSLPYRQFGRNETLTSLLARCPTSGVVGGSGRGHLMDRRGEGVPLILGRSERLSGRRPEYLVIDDAEVRLTIFSAAVP